MDKKIIKFLSPIFGIGMSFVIFFMIALLIPEKNNKDHLLKENAGIFFAKIKKEKVPVKNTDSPVKEVIDKDEIDKDYDDFTLIEDILTSKSLENFKFRVKRQEKKEDFSCLFEEKEVDKNEYIQKKVKEVKKKLRTAFDYNEVETKPFVIKSVKPEFPFRARRRGIKKGRIVLKFMVNKEGIPEKIEVFSSTHLKIFDESAVTALKEWRFNPGFIKGKKVNTILFLPVKYEIKN